MNLSELAKIPMRSESEMRMVEIIVLKWKRPDLESECARRIIQYTKWPFKLVFYDNRLNTPNTSRIWNKLTAQATCDYICMIDSDAYVPDVNPCWLSRMMQTFGRQNCKMVLPITNNCSTPQQKVPVDAYPSAVEHNGEWSGFCFLFRRDLMESIGKFDEEFVGYGQDSEFAIRMTKNGGGVYIRRDVYVEHVHGGSFKSAAASGEYDALADRAYAQKLFIEKTQ